jgi:hypothetical protein
MNAVMTAYPGWPDRPGYVRWAFLLPKRFA